MRNHFAGYISVSRIANMRRKRNEREMKQPDLFTGNAMNYLATKNRKALLERIEKLTKTVKK